MMIALMFRSGEGELSTWLCAKLNCLVSFEEDSLVFSLASGLRILCHTGDTSGGFHVDSCAELKGWLER